MPSIVQGVALDSNGNALASPSVTVYTANTTTTVSIYSDKAAATVKANPFTGDAAGRWSFYVATGTYDLKFVAGTTTYTLEDVEVQDLLAHASRHHEGGADEIDPDQLEVTTPLALIVPTASGVETAIGLLESYLADPDGHLPWQLENIEAALKDLYELAESATGAAASATSFPWDPRLHWESSFLDALRSAESNTFLVAEQAFTLPDHDNLPGFVAGEHILEAVLDHGSIAGLADKDHPQYFLIGPPDHWESAFGEQIAQIEGGLADLGELVFEALTKTRYASIQYVIDGGGSAITTGEKGHIEIPFDCTIKAVRALADQSGSIVVDLWAEAYSGFPPANANSITASAPVTISTDTDSEDTTLTGWTTSLTRGQILAFNVDSAATIERVTISLSLTRD